jgi:hypothetical protein
MATMQGRTTLVVMGRCGHVMRSFTFFTSKGRVPCALSCRCFLFYTASASVTEAGTSPASMRISKTQQQQTTDYRLQTTDSNAWISTYNRTWGIDHHTPFFFFA